MVTIEQLRRSRRRDVKADRFTFTVELPTEFKLYQMIGDGNQDALVANGRLVKSCVIGWKDVRECDLVDAGTEDELIFERGIFEEWIEDQMPLWEPIVATIFEMRKDRDAKRGGDQKNS